MKVYLNKGEYLWSEEGTHVFDKDGFAVMCQEDCVVTMKTKEAYLNAVKIIATERAKNGKHINLRFPKEDLN
jgi:hypothetical protein